jgi:DNA mismatch repair ATPase MutS
MSFQSILFENPADRIETQHADAPPFFRDLNLDQIVDAIAAAWPEFDLKPFFYVPLSRIEAIKYRHEVMQDLENPTLFEQVKGFARNMRTVREHLAQAEKLYYERQKQAWLLETVGIYCDAIIRFANDLVSVGLKSRGLLAFREYVTNYAASARFTSLVEETKTLKANLAAVRYCVVLKGNAIKVRKYESEIDYSTDVEETFEKFKHGAVKDYKAKYSTNPDMNHPDMNHIEAKILDFVAQLHPEVFSDLERYCAASVRFLDEAIAVFDREVHFYIAYLEHIAKLQRAGLLFCYPQILSKSKEVYDYEGFDLALAHVLITENKSIVCNDFYLKNKERVIVVTGPNQGGKTTFARTFGQLHYLASIGCPVPGREAQLFLFDRLFTHFEKEERIDNPRGKLQDDLVRIRSILKEATSSSIIIMNEVFTSTTLQDAIFLSRRVMETLVRWDLLCVWVTFIDELASASEQTASMVSTIVPENPTLRTFKVVRRPADGLSYAMSIAAKYRLTYDCLKERVKS